MAKRREPPEPMSLDNTAIIAQRVLLRIYNALGGEGGKMMDIEGILYGHGITGAPEVLDRMKTMLNQKFQGAGAIVFFRNSDVGSGITREPILGFSSYKIKPDMLEDMRTLADRMEVGERETPPDKTGRVDTLLAKIGLGQRKGRSV